ncbi:IclR family transcriptional regulator [Bifidobacterium callitrichidarum]|uniref:IclR family transcriptional regulator n=1 Tax=Bifidobacterium callitrichidarum TaxID=2052941 RepID=A0A2U2MY91_9BIFI|nr:helix-turn-helix domain-containing protein [Bifidobacterium callitrichidarum]PWG61788.1 IclR family transcriptional regulator [Bifidobacterium callitrichidarum]
MAAQGRDDRSVEALVKSKAVLDVLSHGPSTVREISESTGEPVSSTYRLLDNLSAAGWVERGLNRGEYRLGIACVRIGGQIESGLDIQQIARRVFRAHRGQFGVWGLFVRRRLRSVCIETRTREALQSYGQLVGNSVPISVGAPSLVLVSWLNADRYDQLLEHYAYTNEMGGTFSTMRVNAVEHARVVRESGFAFDVGQTLAGSVTIGVPVFNHAGEVQAAVVLGGLSRSLEPGLSALQSPSGAIDAASAGSRGADGRQTGTPARNSKMDTSDRSGTGSDTDGADEMVRLVQSVGCEISRGLGYFGDYLGLGLEN